MRVLLFTVGSEGDVRPFVALAGRLRAEGHDPVLAAPALYQGLAAAVGVAFEPLDLDMTEVGRAVAGRHGLRHLLTFARAMGERAGGTLPAAGAAATAHGPVDLVVHHPVVPIRQHLAELLGVTAVVAALAPAATLRTAPLPSAAVPMLPLSARLTPKKTEVATPPDDSTGDTSSLPLATTPVAEPPDSTVRFVMPPSVSPLMTPPSTTLADASST